jgi:hypothetical protein
MEDQWLKKTNVQFRERRFEIHGVMTSNENAIKGECDVLHSTDIETYRLHHTIPW